MTVSSRQLVLRRIFDAARVTYEYPGYIRYNRENPNTFGVKGLENKLKVLRKENYKDNNLREGITREDIRRKLIAQLDAYRDILRFNPGGLPEDFVWRAKIVLSREIRAARKQFERFAQIAALGGKKDRLDSEDIRLLSLKGDTY